MDPQETLPDNSSVTDNPSEPTNIVATDIQEPSSNKSNKILLIVGIIVGFLLLVVVILLLIILPKLQNTNNLIEVTPTSSVVPTDIEITDTVSITATDEPVITSTDSPTISPTTSNFSAHSDWKVFDSRTASIYGTKPEKGLFSEFHFKYPEGMIATASYSAEDGGVFIELYDGDPAAITGKPYFLSAPGYKLAGSDTLKSLTAMELQSHFCMPFVNEWKDSVKHSYLKLGTYTWNKATVDVTYTCDTNSGGIFGPAEALGILSKKDQLIFVVGVKEPFSNNMLESLKTFEFIY